MILDGHPDTPDVKARPEMLPSTNLVRNFRTNIALNAALALGALVGLFLFYGLTYSIHHDLAGSALSGLLAVTLGESFGEYSLYFPPAEQGWFTLAVWLSNLVGLRLDLAVVLMTGVAVLFSCGLAYKIHRTAIGASPLFLVASVLLLVMLPIFFKNVFGLREHMVILGLWPYLVLRIADPAGTKVAWKIRLLVGIWMGATLLLKYLYSIVVLLVEVVDAVMWRRPLFLFRIENLLAGAIVALYLFFWLVVDQTQRDAIGAVVSAIDANLKGQQANLTRAIVCLVPAPVFLLLARTARLPARTTCIALAMVIGAIIVSWTQARWYSHHLFPIVVAYLAWWWMARNAMKLWGHVVIALLMLVPVMAEFSKTAFHQESVKELDLVLEEAGQSMRGKRVGVLTMHPSPYNQHLAAHGGLRWNASVNNSYVAAELHSFDRPENEGFPPPPVTLDDPGRRMLHDEFLRLWEDMPPDILILDDSTNWPLRHIDVEWTQVFSEDTRFNAILAQYRPVASHDGENLRFRLYVRLDQGT